MSTTSAVSELTRAAIDPHAPFGFAESPAGLFMVVTLIYVLNVLLTVEARLEVMHGAAVRLAPEGVLIVATRSSAAVRSQAARSGWRAWGDGFVSHEGRGTFQHGVDAEEMVGMGEMLGLRSPGPLPTVRDASLVALARRTPTTGSACGWKRRPRDRPRGRASPTRSPARASADCRARATAFALICLHGRIAVATAERRWPGWYPPSSSERRGSLISGRYYRSSYYDR